MSKKQIVTGLFIVYALMVLVCFAGYAWQMSHFGLEVKGHEILECIYGPAITILFTVLLFLGVNWLVDRLSKKN